MEALLTSFIAAGLAEWGDKTQLLVIALATRFGRPGPVLAGVAVAALANALIAAAGGIVVHGFVVIRALTLLLGLALVCAGVGGLIRRRAPSLPERLRVGPFATAAVLFFIAELGDKTQFLTFAISARFDSMLLAAAGACAGVIAACAPAALLGGALPRQVPVRAIRLGAAILFLLSGFAAGVAALGLV